jgi:hypothetical protein
MASALPFENKHLSHSVILNILFNPCIFLGRYQTDCIIKNQEVKT